MSQHVTGIFRACLLVIILTVSGAMYGAVFSGTEASRSGDAENWNFADTSYSPENPTENDFITFQLEVNNDENIDKVQIFICKNNICGLPKEMKSISANTYSYKHTEKLESGTKVDYRFLLTYSNTTESEKIPHSAKTDNVATVQGSLYFEFFMGENWNYQSATISPVSPKDSDSVTFTLAVNDDQTIEKVMIEIVQIKPIFSQELPLEMTHSGTNTFSYTRTSTFDGGATIGYRFHIKYKGSEDLEVIPIDSGTANVVEEQGELYFSFSVLKSGGDNGNGGSDSNDKEDDGGIPLFLIIGIVIIVIVVVVIIVFITKGKKK